jgi:hypothetical protein
MAIWSIYRGKFGCGLIATKRMLTRPFSQAYICGRMLLYFGNDDAQVITGHLFLETPHRQ